MIATFLMMLTPSITVQFGEDRTTHAGPAVGGFAIFGDVNTIKLPGLKAA